MPILSKNWFEQRSALRQDVLSAVKATNPRMTVKGSFAHGNFHLSRTSPTTFSDVDVVLSSSDRSRHDWEADVKSRLTLAGWDIRVSVQHTDSTAGISIHDSRLLYLGELIRFWDKLKDPDFAAYLYGKTTLAFWQSFLSPRANDHSIHTEVALSAAFLSRTGYSALFSREEAEYLLYPYVEKSEAVRQFLRLLKTGNVKRSRLWFLNELESSSIQPWLRHRMIEILNSQSEGHEEIHF